MISDIEKDSFGPDKIKSSLLTEISKGDQVYIYFPFLFNDISNRAMQIKLVFKTKTAVTFNVEMNMIIGTSRILLELKMLFIIFFHLNLLFFLCN